jgi:hypothetical protein
VAIGSRRRVCSGYEEEDRELSSHTRGCYNGRWVVMRVGWIETGIGMRGDGKKEATQLACEVARGRGGKVTNAHEGGGAVGVPSGAARGGDAMKMLSLRGQAVGEMDARLPCCTVGRWAHVSSGSGNTSSRLPITDDVAARDCIE